MDTSMLKETETLSNTTQYPLTLTDKVQIVADPLLTHLKSKGGLITAAYADKYPSITTKIMTYTGLTLTPTLNSLLDDHIRHATEERHEEKDHVIYTSFPDIRDVRTRVYWGVFSWSLPQWKARYLLKQSALRIQDLPLSPGDIVRDYLDFYHPKRLRCIGAEARIYEEHVSAPLYFRPFTTMQGTYIDIESTYFSILKLIGWNINYLPGQWLIPGRAPLDWPLPEHKGARNYLVSIGLPRPMLVWSGRQFVQQAGKNAHINRGLWLAVMDILHSIATIAISLGAKYVHTDGYILPSNSAPILIRAISDWGLNARVLGEGETYVFGMGNYSVGDKKSKLFNPEHLGKPISSIREVNSRWLQKSVQKIVTNRVAEHLYNTWNID